MRTKLILLIGILSFTLAYSQAPQQAALEKFHPDAAPPTKKLLLKKGDRLAICGDSITEQKMYSRLIEDYLTMCVPELDVTVRQYGWGGERAHGFLARMTNDCLRFKPTIATTCYGMNDHEYRAYEDRIGVTYRTNSEAIVEAFKAHGVRVVQGSPGCVGKVPQWGKKANENSLDDLNQNLCQLRNIGIDIARKENVAFADVFGPMVMAGAAAQQSYGTNYAIAGKDGVHPGWAGHTVMAYAFLKALGLNGEIGTFTVNLNKSKMTASKGHKVLSGKDGVFEVESARYPFCSCVCDVADTTYPRCGQDSDDSDTTIRSGLTLVPFNAELNRFMLVVKGAKGERYKVTWGNESKEFTGRQLADGINLTQEFARTPFCSAFGQVDAAVAAEQAYETKQIKTMFRSPEAKADMEAVAAKSEADRAPLAQAIKSAFVPVSWTLKIEPLK
jgi:lysophospholipase L1-like esterase